MTVRLGVLALLIVALLSSAGCRSQQSSVSDAQISVGDGGVPEIRFGSRKAELPPTDVAKDAGPVVVTQDTAGRRLAYPTVSGHARLVYVVGDGLFVGPLLTQPVSFRAAPDVDHTLALLFETAGTAPRRAELVREVRRERGEGSVVRLLVDAAYVDDPAWDEASESLSPWGKKWLRDALAVGLEPGKSAVLLRRAVAVVDLNAPGRGKLIVARAKELADGSQEPRAVAVLLRSVMLAPPTSTSATSEDKSTPVAIACEVLAKKPATIAKGSGRESLIEAALLTLAVNQATCEGPLAQAALAQVESVLMAEPCMPYVRCNDGGAAVSWNDSSNQDEPLCTKEQLATAIRRDSERAPLEILRATTTRTELFAYALLLEKDRLPATFLAAHARRRYAITQPAEPTCDSGLTPGTACHCDEPAIRSAACRQPEGSSVEKGFCHFDVDDKQKKILNVVAGRGTP